MTKNEVLPLCISGLSLLVSIISAIRASKASAIANMLRPERNELALRQERSSEHVVFAQKLLAVKESLEGSLSEFVTEVGRAYNKIADTLDLYDTQRNRTRRLGHIYRTFCNLIYAGLSSQLVW